MDSRVNKTQKTWNKVAWLEWEHKAKFWTHHRSTLKTFSRELTELVVFKKGLFEKLDFDFEMNFNLSKAVKK